jgi:hypothetical protein
LTKYVLLGYRVNQLEPYFHAYDTDDCWNYVDDGKQILYKSPCVTIYLRRWQPYERTEMLEYKSGALVRVLSGEIVENVYHLEEHGIHRKIQCNYRYSNDAMSLISYNQYTFVNSDEPSITLHVET